MEKFRTIVDVVPSEDKIGYENKVLMIGSCFSENIGAKLQEHKFDVDINPFGILFNPESIRLCLKSLLSRKIFTEEDLVERDGVWHSMLHHGDFSGSDKGAVLGRINLEVERASKFLREADYLVITLGTAWVYEWEKTGDIVGNCHKFPNSEFEKRKLGVNEIISEMTYILNHVRNFNSKLKVLFTISPVRHWRDGAVENNWSKSTLNMAVHELVRRFKFCSYFPSFEIMMDDLRDYRFYKEDMLHPSQQAIDYIWEKFEAAWIDPEARDTMSEVEKLGKALKHRPIDPESPAHKVFLQKRLEDIARMKSQWEFLDLHEEEELIHQGLAD